MRFGPRLGVGSRESAPEQGGNGLSVPSLRSWSPTLLLCLATALLTWAVTSAALTGEGAERSGDAVVYAPPVPAEQSERDLARGAPRPASLRAVKAPAGGDAENDTPAVTAPTQRLRAVHLSVPSIGVERDLVELAVNGETLQVPDRYSDVGWWRDGPTPGSAGAAVVVGHVDSPTGPAVFYELSGMKRGQSVVVKLSDRSRQVFKVRQAVLYDRSVIPSQRVYRQGGRPGLNLVTCGGSYDSAADAYSGNVVVYTDLVKRLPPPAKSTRTKKRPAEEPRAATD